MLHAPGLPRLRERHPHGDGPPDVVSTALELKKIGNDVWCTLVGGREIHPINVRVGGFYRVPRRSELAPLAERLEVGARGRARDGALGRGASSFPDFEQDYEFVALRHPTSTRSTRGASSRTAASTSRSPSTRSTSRRSTSRTRTRSTRCSRRTGAYLVGPLARYSLNFDRLPAVAQRRGAGGRPRPDLPQPVQEHRGPRRSRLVFACDEALRIIDGYEPPERPAVDAPCRGRAAATALTEAPRGMLYHRYGLDAEGIDPGRRRSSRRPPRTRRRSRTTSGSFVPDEPRPARRRAPPALRAGDPQLRPLHLVRDPLPEARGGPPVTRHPRHRDRQPGPRRRRGRGEAGSSPARPRAQERRRARVVGRGLRPARVMARPGERHPHRCGIRGRPARFVRRFEAHEQPLPASSLRTSTHSLGVVEAIELARSLGELPRHVVVFAIEGRSFEPGRRSLRK